MPFDAKTCFASHTFEQPVQVTLGELDYLVARRADQVMTVRGLRRSVTVTTVIQVHPAHDANFYQDVQCAIHRDQPQARVTASRALVNFRRGKRLVHSGDYFKHGAARGGEFVSSRIERLIELIRVETHGYLVIENYFQLKFYHGSEVRSRGKVRCTL